MFLQTREYYRERGFDDGIPYIAKIPRDLISRERLMEEESKKAEVVLQKDQNPFYVRVFHFLISAVTFVGIFGSLILPFFFPHIMALIPILGPVAYFLHMNLPHFMRSSAIIFIIDHFLLFITSIVVVRAYYLISRYMAVRRAENNKGKEFKLIPELSSLPQLTTKPAKSNGWRIVDRLPDGRIAISREVFQRLSPVRQKIMFEDQLAGIRESTLSRIGMSATQKVVISRRRYFTFLAPIVEPITTFIKMKKATRELLGMQDKALMKKFILSDKVTGRYGFKKVRIVAMGRRGKVKLSDDSEVRVVGVRSGELRGMLEGLKREEEILVLQQYDSDRAFLYKNLGKGKWVNINYEFISNNPQGIKAKIQNVDLDIPFIINEEIPVLSEEKLGAEEVVAQRESKGLVEERGPPEEVTVEGHQTTISKKTPFFKRHKLLIPLFSAITLVALGIGGIWISPVIFGASLGGLILVKIGVISTGIGITQTLMTGLARLRKSKNAVLGEEKIEDSFGLGIKDIDFEYILEDLGLSKDDLTQRDLEFIRYQLDKENQARFVKLNQKKKKEMEERKKGLFNFIKKAILLIPHLMDSFFFRYWRFPLEYRAVSDKDFIGEEERKNLIRGIILSRLNDKIRENPEQILSRYIPPSYERRGYLINAIKIYLKTGSPEDYEVYLREIENFQSFLKENNSGDFELRDKIIKFVETLDLSKRRYG